MATARKRISELTALTSASLDTVIVGVDNGTTYKIELDVLADAVTSRVNTLDRERLSSLESVTSSFETKGRSVVSSSVQITNLGFTTTSSFQSFSSSVHSEILAATNEQDLTPYVTELVYGVLSSSVDSRIDNLEANSGSYLTSLNGAISSSSQLTSSYDERYVLSGSITQTTWDNINGKPSGLVSQSTDLSLLNAFSESIDNRVDALESFSSSLNSTFATDLEVSIVSSSVAATIGVISQNTGLVSTSSFNQYTASQSTSSLVNRLNAIESVSGSWITESETGSFLTSLSGAISSSNQLTESFDTRYTLSGSVQPLPNDLISSSAQITAYGFISSSDSTNELNSYTSSLKNAIELTGSTVSFLGNIVIYGTQSVINSTNVELSDNILYLSPTASTDNDLGIVGHYNDGTYRHAGIFMDASDGHSWKVFNGLQTETTAIVDTSGTGFTLADFKAGVITGTSFNGVINATNGVISGSSQLTSSFDTRYAISASYLTSLNGAISSSSQLTGSFDTRYALSGSGGSLPSGLISGSSQLTSSFATTGSNSFNGNQTITGSLIVSSVAVVNGGVTIPTGSIISLTSGSNLFVDASGGITGSLSGSVFGIGDVVAFSSSVNTRINNIVSAPAGTISGSSQLTSSFDTRYTLSGSVQQLPSGVISGSSQLTSSLDTIYLTIGGDNVISGSSQLTASLDTRYAASGSVGGVAPAGTVSGSSQLTSSLDLRYLVTGSVTSSILQLNIFTSSINVWSSSLATTGSNTFNGNQTITGSLNLTNGNIVASQITANTSSLYLTSGSNMYVQNNGIVEITGSLLVSGSANLNVGALVVSGRSGDEGGEINLAVPVTNTTLENRVNVDVFQNRFRIFEGSANAKGVYVDLNKSPNGASGEITYKNSGIVNAGDFVQLDNLKATVSSSGNRSLSIASVSGTFTAWVNGTYGAYTGGAGGGGNNLTVTTTAALAINWNFTSAGDCATYIINDTTNNRVYRVTMLIMGSYLNNFISIERLH